ncbi:penicillin-binding protein [Streptomyces sp. RB6PN25]|uniref:Penicillin-binding protein n=1 Tax=Streptomyces humicola TaxID=2953240 RepID=A0ABT1PPK2_9ACTN|nr:transglycosylase domain-containing protein [Streptomyces humicola]MCQ4079603.1 penicillin-binding protein [Streptomyces humicola]
MSEHRRKPSRPIGGGQPGGRPDGMGPGGEQPRMTRAEMRKAAQAANRRSGRRRSDGRRVDAGRGTPSGKRRFIDYPRSGKRGLRRWLPSWKQVLSVFVIGFGGMLGAVAFAYATVSIPSPNPSTQLQNNVFYWADGTQMASVGQVDRQNVNLSEIPPPVQWDFLAAENSSFYTDPGVDPQGILRAVYHMASGGDVQSGSTITQQFVKNYYLNQNQTITRKLDEIMISLKIGTKYSKEQILQGYLNTNYYGRGAYGIQAAAEAYYGIPANKLNVSQGAFLTATVNEPSLMMNADTDPVARQTAEARWTYVLDRMVKIGQLSATDEAKWKAAGFPTPKPMATDSGMSGQVGYLVDAATKYVESHANITDQQFNKGGYQIYTTFDKNKVSELSTAVAKMSKNHLDPQNRSADKNVQVGAASVDPKTGAIVALYGGPGYDKGHYTDNADATGVPVGSTFKPFDLAAAIDHGAVLSPGQQPSQITPSSKFNGDDGIEIKDQNGNYITDSTDPTGLLHQHNDTNQKWGYIPLSLAMQQSVNTPYVQLGEYVGYDTVEQEAIKAGLLRSSLQYNTAGFFIGTSTPSAIRMADAYSTFDDAGVEHDPYSVTRVLHADSNGSEQLPGFDAPTGNYAMPASTANTVTNVLQGVVQQGTGTNAKALGRPAAGKTGTTDDYKSAWFIGYTPQLTTAVSMFKEDPNNVGLQSMVGVGGYSKVFGADMPTEVWTDYMTAALAGQPVQQFPPAPPTGQGANENGAPTASPTPTTTPTATATASATPSPTLTPCFQRKRGCASPSPTDTSTSTTGGFTGGFFGGTSSGTTGGGNTSGTTSGTTNGGTTGGTTTSPSPKQPGG